MSSPARTPNPRRVRRFASVFAIVALIASVLIAPTAAYADPTSSISGVVSDANGPVEGIQVTLFDGYNQGPTVPSGADGTYSFVGLEPGNDYKLDFSDALPVVGTPHMRSYWPGVADYDSAEPIALLPDQELIGVDITLDIAPSVSGTVTGATGVIEGVLVKAYPLSNPFDVRQASTDTDGKYTIVMPYPDEVTLYFEPSSEYVAEWYDDVATQDEATVLSLGLGVAAVVDATLATYVEPVPGTVKGTVTDDASDLPIEGADVTLYQDGDYYDYQTTDEAGAYSFSGLAPGSYKVEVSGPFGYTTEFYSNKSSLATANALSITAAGETKTANVALVGPITGSIAGKVTGINSANLPDATVSAYDEYDTWIASATTETNGNYVVGGLPAGTYRLEISGPSGSDYVTEWYSNKTSFENATAIPIAAGENVASKNVLLIAAASISGKVTDSGGNLEGVQVSAETAGGAFAMGDTTDASGNYTITGLIPGTYTLSFTGVPPTWEYMPQWWNNSPTLEDATTITVTSGQTITGKNATLVKGTSIAGKVTGTGGAAVEDASVYVYDADYSYVGSASSDGSGNYKISGLAPGSYRLQIFGPWESGYITEWYNNKTSFYESTPVPLAAAQQLTGKNIALIKGATISGKVTSSTGNIANAWVVAMSPSGGWVANAYTNASGNYTITSLPAGTYTLEFSGGSPENNFVAEYWNNQPTLEDANTFSVVAGQVVTGKNALLAKGAKVSGVVKNAAGAPLANVRVQVSNGTDSDSAYTDSAGKYSIAGLKAGTYTIYSYQATMSNESEIYYDEWWNNKTSEETATKVALIAGQSFAGNLVLDKRPTISGKVTNSGGVAIAGVVVTARSTTTGSEIEVKTNSSGGYTVKGLEAGKYTLEFDSPGNHVTEWYNNKTTLAAGTPVTLTRSQVLTAINASLATGATISGTIKGASNALLNGAVVTAYTPTGEVAGTAKTTSTGKYTISGLPAGTYKVRFSALGYIPIWWLSKTTLATSTGIPVTAAQAVIGRDVVLSKGGTITGNVKGDGANLEKTYVTAFNSFGDFAGFAQTNTSGNYSIAGLYPGQYTLQFRDYEGVYYEQWYLGKTSQATATKVTVSAGVTTSGRNVVLVAGGTISGNVKLAGSTPSNAEGASVTAYNSVGGMAASANTDSSGNYTLDGLAVGIYKLEFRAPWDAGAYVDQWYLNKTSLATANAITVGAGATITGKNVVLAAYNPGSISGNLKGGTTNLAGYWVYAYKAGSQQSVSSDSTDAAGNYKIADLEPGTYKLYFTRKYNDATWVSEWYNNKTTFASATTVTVASGQAVTGKDGVLAKSASVSGNIKGGSPAANLAGVQVFAERVDDYGSAWAVTDASGNYKIVGLEPGTYIVVAELSKSAYAETWWGGKYTHSEAPTFTVGAAASVTGKNIVMAKAATISGSLSATSGQKLDGIQVLAYRKTSSGYEPYSNRNSFLQSNGLGAYSVPGLAPGTYALQFLDNATGNSYGVDAGLQYNTEYWQDKSTLATATPLTVTAGQVLTGKNGVLLKK